MKPAYLYGVTEEKVKPEFSMEACLSGEYQLAYNDWFDNNFFLKNDLTKLHNQFKYSIFNTSANKNVVVGKENVLFEPSYIKEYLGLAPTATEEYLKRLVDNIKEIQEISIAANKPFVLIITPSKANFYSEYIPDKYYYAVNNEDNQVSRAYDIFKRLLDVNEIKYFDTIPFLKEEQKQDTIPIFPNTGTHWNEVSAVKSLNEIISYINSEYNTTLSTVEFIDIKKGQEPMSGMDADIYNLMNIIKGRKDATYYLPIINNSTVNSEYNLFLEGGSFCYQLLQYLPKVFNKIDYIYYNMVINEYSENRIEMPEGTKEEHLDEVLKNKDIICLEVNEEAIGSMGQGFVEALAQYLREKGFPPKEYIKAFDPNGEDEDLVSYTKGIYGREYFEGVDRYMHWINQEAEIELQDERIKEKGVLIEFNAEETYLGLVNDEEKYIEIYINSVLVRKEVIHGGLNQIHISMQELPESIDSKYEIKLINNAGFNPAKHLGTTDDRQISLMLAYVGIGI